MLLFVEHVVDITSRLTISLSGSDKKCGSENNREPRPRNIRPAAIYRGFEAFLLPPKYVIGIIASINPIS